MKLEWTSLARLDLARIAEFCEARSDAWADHVEQRIAERASSLAELPLQGRTGMVEGTRELSIPDIQYVLVYELDGDLVRFLRVWSTLEDR